MPEEREIIQGRKENSKHIYIPPSAVTSVSLQRDLRRYLSLYKMSQKRNN